MDSRTFAEPFLLTSRSPLAPTAGWEAQSARQWILWRARMVRAVVARTVMLGQASCFARIDGALSPYIKSDDFECDYRRRVVVGSSPRELSPATSASELNPNPHRQAD
jgi:hypothetical protein